MNVITKIKNDEYFSNTQKEYIKSQVKQVDNDVSVKFNNLYYKWHESCVNLLESTIDDDIYQCKTLPEIDDLKTLGSQTIPLYIQKLAKPDELSLSIVPYRVLQEKAELLRFDEDHNPLAMSIEEHSVYLVDLWLADNNVI